MKNIYAVDPFYEVLLPYVNTCFKFSYSKLEVEGLENLPKNQPYILAPNHQNALMDALAILATKPSRTVFLARSDIFRRPSIAAILHILKIMPVYRLRDGHNELAKNQDTFNKSVDVLKAGVALCLMPEGQQSPQHSLLPLVKGMFRIAVQAQQQLTSNTLFIVPVGIDYGDYINEGAHIIVRYGKPISVGTHMDAYVQHPAQGLKNLLQEVAEGMDSLMLNIRSVEFYQPFFELTLMFGSELNGCCRTDMGSVKALEGRMKLAKALDKEATDNRPQVIELLQQLEQYKCALKECQLTDEAVAQNKTALHLLPYLLLLLVSSPIVLYAWIVNALPTYLPRLVTKKFESHFFVASVRFGLYIVLLLLISLIVLMLSAFTALPCWAAPLLFASTLLLRRTIFWFGHTWSMLGKATDLIIAKIRDEEKVGILFEMRSKLKHMVSG